MVYRRSSRKTRDTQRSPVLREREKGEHRKNKIMKLSGKWMELKAIILME